MDGKTDDEKQQLQENPQIWNVHIVLNVLHSLIVKSNINAQLEVRPARSCVPCLLSPPTRLGFVGA